MRAKFMIYLGMPQSAARHVAAANNSWDETHRRWLNVEGEQQLLRNFTPNYMNLVNVENLFVVCYLDFLFFDNLKASKECRKLSLYT